jgi:hypothetical protein
MRQTEPAAGQLRCHRMVHGGFAIDTGRPARSCKAPRALTPTRPRPRPPSKKAGPVREQEQAWTDQSKATPSLNNRIRVIQRRGLCCASCQPDAISLVPDLPSLVLSEHQNSDS